MFACLLIATKRVLKYIKATLTLHIMYSSFSTSLIEWYDFDWCKNIDNQQSIPRYLFQHVGGTIGNPRNNLFGPFPIPKPSTWQLQVQNIKHYGFTN
jgi:hypothetical protein